MTAPQDPPAAPDAAAEDRPALITADLAALGLPATATQVLARLGGEGWTTSMALAAQLEVSRPVICRAVDVLVEAGLVQRSRGRRPAPLRLHPDVEQVLAAHLRTLAARRREDGERAERAAGWLRDAAAEARERPAPVHELDPAGTPPDYRLATCRATYDEVCRPTGWSVLFSGGMAQRGVRRRLLVTGAPRPDRAAWLQWAGVELRVTEDVLPAVLIADDRRARVEVSTDGRAGRTAWTYDAAQVAALRRLFSLWWAEAEPWRADGPAEG